MFGQPKKSSPLGRSGLQRCSADRRKGGPGKHKAEKELSTYQGALEGTLKGALKGNLKGALKGALQGALKGALKGALQGALQGALRGTPKGALKVRTYGIMGALA